MARIDHIESSQWPTGDLQQELARLRQENTRLKSLLNEAGVNAERAAVLLAQSETEHCSALAQLEDACERQSLHMGELAHRLRNTISLVQAVTNQSLRGAVSIDAAREAVTLRLGALWKVHEALLASDWTGASVEAVVEGIITLHGERFVTQGRKGLRLDAQAALALGLTLHELATNAAKYGALSLPVGKVRIRWHARRDNVRWAYIRAWWVEEGGPPITQPPKRRGFGSKLIERSMAGAGGSVRLAYKRTGLTCSLLLPLNTHS